MGLAEINTMLREADCSDLESVATILTLRARLIAEFAASADAATLAEALDGGQEFLQRLEDAQWNISRELHNLKKLKQGLLANLTPQRPDDQVVCFG